MIRAINIFLLLILLSSFSFGIRVGDLNISGSIFSDTGSIDWTVLSNFPTACPAGQAVQTVGTTLGCISISDGNQNLREFIEGNDFFLRGVWDWNATSYSENPIDILFTPTTTDLSAINIDINLNSQPDTTAIDIRYDIDSFSSGQTIAANMIEINTDSNDGGTIFANNVLKIGDGNTTVIGLNIGPGVDTIFQSTGPPDDLNVGLLFAADTNTFTNVTSEFLDPGDNVKIFGLTQDEVYVANGDLFSFIEFKLEADASIDLKPTFAYSDGSGGFASFVPGSTLDGFQQNGEVFWNITDLNGWATDDVNGNSDLYWIKITRTLVSDGVVGQWHLNESSGTNAPDSSAFDNNGTLNNMEDGDWVPGKLNNALQFDGIDEFVDMNVVGDFNRTDPFSYQFWFQTANSNTQYIFSKQEDSGNQRGWASYIASGRINAEITSMTSGNRILLRTDDAFDDNVFHHVAITYDGSVDVSGLIIYVDNVVVATTTITNNLTGTILNDTNTQISGRNGPNDTFDGLIDEIVIHDINISAADVNASFNNGNGTEFHGVVIAPIEKTVSILTATEFFWDSNANIFVSTVSIDDYGPGMATNDTICKNGDQIVDCLASSSRYKRNIVDSNSDFGLSTIQALRPVVFQYNLDYASRDEPPHVGFIAEEVELISTLLVDYIDGDLESVNYIDIIPVLTKAVQELKAEHDLLEAAFCTEFPGNDLCT